MLAGFYERSGEACFAHEEGGLITEQISDERNGLREESQPWRRVCQDQLALSVVVFGIYLEALAGSPGYKERVKLSFPFEVAHLFVRDTRLVELSRGGHFEPLLSEAARARRRGGMRNLIVQGG